MEWFNEMFDLAAVASGAGLAGGGGAAILAWSIKGAIMRFIARTLITAVLTGIGFYFLLGWLGFEIVPRDEVAAAPAPRASVFAQSDSFMPAERPAAGDELAGAGPETGEETAEEDRDERRIVVSSPFRRGGR